MKKWKDEFRKFLPILMFFSFVFIPFFGVKVFAYSGGLLNGLTMTIADDYNGNVSKTNLVTDNSESTSVNIGADGSTTDTLYYTFPSDVSIGSFRLKMTGNFINTQLLFYNVTGTLIYSKFIDSDLKYAFDGSVYTLPSAISGIRTVAIHNYYNSAKTVNEFDVFSPSIVHSEITNLTNSVSNNNVMLSYSVPSANSYFTGSKIYRNGVLISTQSKSVNSFSDNNLSYNQTYTYKVTALYSDGFETSGITTNAITGIYHDEIPSLTVDSNSYDTAELKWVIPINNYLVGFNVYRDGNLVKTLDKISNFYKDTGLFEDSTHSYRVTALYYDGFETSGITKTVTTPFDPVIKDVIKANIKVVSHKQINLSWTLPTQSRFKDVRIFRSETPKQQGFFSYLVSGTTVYAADQTEIFQTNGTYFNDLTVKPDMNYEYTLKTETTDGSTSDGVTLTADTPSEPTPIYVPDGQYTTNANGDYIFKWTSPSVGTVKVLVGGKDYKTVAASSKQITIPKSDMVINVFGDPNVSVIPIGEFGTEGSKVFIGGNALSSTKLPFSVPDLIGSGNGLLLLVGPLVLMALSFMLIPKFRRVIVTAFGKFRKSDEKESIKTDTNERLSKIGREKRKEKPLREPRLDRSYFIKKEPRIKREGKERIREPKMPRIPRIRGDN